MHLDGMRISVITLFLVMFAAVLLQISVFLDPQNNLITGGVTSVGGGFSEISIFSMMFIVTGVAAFAYRISKID